MPQTDIYELLKADHRRVERLFTQIIENPGIQMETVSPSENPFTMLYQSLMTHMKAEEGTYYSQIKEKPETRNQVAEGMKEHDKIRDLLNQTRNLPRNGSQWMSKLRDTQKLIEHHVRDEEGKMFKGAQKVLSEQQAVEIGERFRQRKMLMMGT